MYINCIELNRHYLRARYYNQNVGRFTQMDTWMGRNNDPITLHKYLYANVDPVSMVDPTGNFAGGAGGLSAASGMMNTLALAVIIGPQLIDGFKARLFSEGFGNGHEFQALLEKSPSAQKAMELKRAKLKSKVEEAKKNRGKKLVYHYSDRFSARSIMAMRCGYASKGYSHPDGEYRKSGFYATLLEPWFPGMTQEDLRSLLYAKPKDQDVSHFVAMDATGFRHMGVESYKPGPRGLCIPVSTIYTGRNLMPSK